MLNFDSLSTVPVTVAVSLDNPAHADLLALLTHSFTAKKPVLVQCDDAKAVIYVKEAAFQPMVGAQVFHGEALEVVK